MLFRYGANVHFVGVRAHTNMKNYLDLKKMKKSTISSLLLMAVGLSQYAAASSGTIDFEGEVTAETCYANVNGSGAAQSNADALIKLPSIGVGALSSAGDTAGTTRFSIVVSQDAGGTNPCAASVAGAPANDVYAYFEAGPENDLNGRLVNLVTATAGAAQNVKLQLLNKDGTQIVAGASGAEPWTAQRSTLESMANALSPGLIHYVQYYSTGVATAGLVSGKAVYTLAYK